MADAKSSDATGMPKSAADLRMAVLEKEMAKMDKERKARDAKTAELQKFAKSFLSEHVSEAEIATVRRLVTHAVEEGKTEALVYSFPSELCTDGGRAINSADKDWPSTLQGKAKEFFDRYQQFGKPLGYKLKAMIINFPNGIPGDVGFFLNWSE